MAARAPRASRRLFLAPDPAAVGAWCRERLTAGAVFVAPSSSARRQALRALAARSGVAVGVTITTPGRLLALLELRAGLPPARRMPDAVERFIVIECARAAGVPLFDGDRAPAGAIRAVTSLLTSLRMNGVSPDEYRAAGGDRRAADACARFDRRRTELGFLDEADRIRRLVDVGLPSLPLIVEELSFAHRLRQDLWLAVFQAAPSVAVGLTHFGDTGPSASIASRLTQADFSLERSAGPPAAVGARAIGGVGPTDETDLVAREMLALLRGSSNAGTTPVPPSAILGVAPNQAYLGLLHRACASIGVPVASPQRISVLDVPLVRTLLETLRLLAEPDQDTADRGLALLSAPYFGCSLDDHDRLSRALVLRGLGSVRSWRRAAPTIAEKTFQKFAECVPALARKLDGPRSPRELAAVLTSLGLEHEFLASGRKHHLAAGNDDAVRMDQQAWDSLLAAITELADALRTIDMPQIGASQWLDELTAILEDSTIRAEARARDGVRLTIAGNGTPSADHVFAVGWREGLVPRRTREAPLLPDRVKRALNQAGALFSTADDRVAREHERYERVRRAARRSLTVSWPATGSEGESLLPSFYLDDMGVTNRRARSVGDTTWPMSLGATRHERVTRAAYLATHASVAVIGDELAAVKDALAALTTPERRGYDGTLIARQETELPPAIVATLADHARQSSASQAKMLAHCVYEHFGKRRLRLEALEAPVLDQLVLGSVIHHALRVLGQRGFVPSAIAPALDDAWAAFVPDRLTRMPAAEFEREMLAANLETLVAAEAERAALVPGTPTHFELAFGLSTEERDPASLDHGIVLALPPGSGIPETVLRGSIDRVDIVDRGGRRYGVATDYKSGRGESYFKEMQERVDFQMPIYSLALPMFGIEPVGAVYLGLASGERYGVIRSDFADDFLVGDDRRRVKQLAPDEFAEYMRTRHDALRVELSRASSGKLAIRPREDTCGYCDLRPVCRIGAFGVGSATSAD
jgi:hypothetical protein